MMELSRTFSKTQRLAFTVARQIAFYIGTKDDCCIIFPIYNLLTRTESPVRIRPDFLTSSSRYLLLIPVLIDAINSNLEIKFETFYCMILCENLF